MPLPPGPLQPGALPAWFARLPVFAPRPDRRVVIVDNQAVSYYLLDGRRDPPELTFLFEDHRVILQIGRQVIDETLHSTAVIDSGMEPDRRGRPRRVGPTILGPGLPGAMNQRMWEGLAALQARGQVVLRGLAQMTAEDRNNYARLSLALHNAGVSEEDARVAADALVWRIPLFTLDHRFRNAAHGALNNAGVAALIREFGRTDFAPSLFVA